MKKTGAQIIWEWLLRQGVSTVFGYPGGAILPAYDAMTQYPIRHILVRHEQGATHMADGFARATGQVGVAIATSGPGATNMVTGIATAMLDSSPIVCITGQVGSKLIGSDAFQETDITGVTLPDHEAQLPGDARRRRGADDSRGVPRRRLRPSGPGADRHHEGRAAVLVRVRLGSAPSRSSAAIGPTTGPAPADFKRAIALIREAKRPLILAGRGIIQSGATEQVVAFAEQTETPIAMTLLGLGGIAANHPLNLGMMGMHGEAWVNTAIQEADLLLAFGMRFDDRVTGNLKTYAPNAKKIHIEIDPAEINKNVRVDVALVGDLREVLVELLPHVPATQHVEWLARIQELKGDSAVRDIQNLPDNGHLYAAHVINDLWRETDGNAIVVTDVGQHQMWEAQYYKHNTPRSLITSGGLGTMGFALPAAIGAKIAKPDAEVWVVVGDGGFQMTMCELATVMQENIDINVAIINNGYLGMVRQWQEFFYEKRYAATPLVNPNFTKLAEAFGLTGITVTRRSEVVPSVKAARNHKGGVVIDFQVEQEDSVYPMVPAGADLHAMIRRPSPIVETAADA